MRNVLLAAALLPLLFGCLGISEGDADPVEDYEQVGLTEAEREEFIQQVQRAIGRPHTAGGETPTEGFDGLGLVLWAFREMDLRNFRDGDEVRRSVELQALFTDNTTAVADLAALQRGDLIFFDRDADDEVEHVVVVDQIDAVDRIWVYDANEAWNVVTHRFIDDLADEGDAQFGRPLKTVAR